MSEHPGPYHPSGEEDEQHALPRDARKEIRDARKWIAKSLKQIRRTLDKRKQENLAPEAIRSRRKQVARALRNAADQVDPTT